MLSFSSTGMPCSGPSTRQCQRASVAYLAANGELRFTSWLAEIFFVAIRADGEAVGRLPDATACGRDVHRPVRAGAARDVDPSDHVGRHAHRRLGNHPLGRRQDPLRVNDLNRTGGWVGSFECDAQRFYALSDRGFGPSLCNGYSGLSNSASGSRLGRVVRSVRRTSTGRGVTGVAILGPACSQWSRPTTAFISTRR